MVDPPPDSAGASTVARDSFTVGVWTALTRVTGLARVVVAGAVFGPTFLANIYQSTNLLPNLLNQLLAGPLIAAVLIPPLVRYLDRSDQAGAQRFANASLGLVLTAFVVAGVFALVAGPVFVRLLTLGVEDQIRGDAQRVTWILLLLLVPQVILYGLIGVATAAQQARGRFRLPAAAPLVENLGIIVTLIFLARAGGSGLEVDGVSTDQLFLLGIGTTVSVAAHALVQWLGARGAGLTLRPTLGWRTPEVRSIMRLAVPSIGSASLEVGIFWAAIIVAGLIPGGVLALQMGVLFSALPFAVAARPIGIALLPRLTRLRRVDSPRLFEEYRAALGLILLLSLPATFGLVAISGSLAKAVAVGTMSTPEGVHLMRVAIASAALAIVPGAVFELARQGAYSARDARSPFYGGVIRAVVIAPGIAAAAFAEGTNTLLILGLATGIADAAAAGYLDRRVRALAPPAYVLGRWLLRQLVTAAVAGLAAWVVSAGLATLDDSRLVTSLAVAAGGATGFIVYAAAQLSLGAPELDAFGVGLPARLRRRA